ncbi:hypothetical protein [Dendronalium phyllosphericum]|uniref:hypothetical protein n=1 Tax=Dendronalium phyllosphericum TaxID=2840445 RepID=UPI001CED194B|nr:hypothetical protein [Dendronalium phyllosphericum]
MAYTIDAAASGTAIDFVEDAQGSNKASGTGTSHLFNYNQQVQTTTTFDPTGTGVVNINNDTIAIANHGFATCQIINYSSGTGGTAIGGLTSGWGYFAIVVDKNTIKLANTI